MWPLRLIDRLSSGGETWQSNVTACDVTIEVAVELSIQDDTLSAVSKNVDITGAGNTVVEGSLPQLRCQALQLQVRPDLDEPGHKFVTAVRTSTYLILSTAAWQVEAA